MKPAAWILLLFVLSGGLSALLGDTLGRRIGKRGLRLFALRPKHTSTLMTMILSMAISAGLFGFYLLVSEQTRQVLLNPDAVLLPVLEKHAADLAHINKTLLPRTEGQLLQKAHSLTPAQPLPSLTNPATATEISSAQPLRQSTLAPAQLSPEANRQRRLSLPRVRSELVRPQPTQTKYLPAQVVDTTLAAVVRPQESSLRLSRLSGPQSAQPQLSQQVYQVLAPAQETLLSFETAGDLPPESVSALLARILDLSEVYADQLGIPSVEGSRLRVSPENIRSLQREIEAGAHQLIAVRTLHAAVNTQPLAIQLVSQPLPQDPAADPAEILEQIRLNPVQFRQSLQQEVLPAIRAALAQRTSSQTVTGLPQLPELQAFVPPPTLGLARTAQVQIRETLLDPEHLRILLWIQPR